MTEANHTHVRLAVARTAIRRLLWDRAAAGALTVESALRLLDRLEGARESDHLAVLLEEIRAVNGGPHRVETRLHPRHLSGMLARVPTASGRKWHSVLDLSRGGFGFRTRWLVPLGAVLRVELADPETGETYQCAGVDVWHDPEARRAGFQFHEVDPALEWRLRLLE